MGYTEIMTSDEALLYLRTKHAVVRFYRDDADNAEMVRVVIEDDTEEYRTVVKKRIEGDVIVAFCQATEQAKSEFEATMRRNTFRAV